MGSVHLAGVEADAPRQITDVKRRSPRAAIRRALCAIAGAIDASWAANGREYEDALGALEEQMGYVAGWIDSLAAFDVTPEPAQVRLRRAIRALQQAAGVVSRA